MVNTINKCRISQGKVQLLIITERQVVAAVEFCKGRLIQFDAGANGQRIAVLDILEAFTVETAANNGNVILAGPM